MMQNFQEVCYITHRGHRNKTALENHAGRLARSPYKRAMIFGETSSRRSRAASANIRAQKSPEIATFYLDRWWVRSALYVTHERRRTADRNGQVPGVNLNWLRD